MVITHERSSSDKMVVEINGTLGIKLVLRKPFPVESIHTYSDQVDYFPFYIKKLSSEMGLNSKLGHPAVIMA